MNLVYFGFEPLKKLNDTERKREEGMQLDSIDLLTLQQGYSRTQSQLCIFYRWAH